MTPLQRRVSRIEETIGAAVFTLEMLVLASFGDPDALGAMARVGEDYRLGRLSGRSFHLYDALVNAGASSRAVQ
jgi:hypothetical protein